MSLSTGPHRCLTDKTIDEYLRGTIGPSAEAAVEEHYLVCPGCAERIQAESEFRGAMIAATAGRLEERRVVRRRAIVRDVSILRDNGQRVFGKSVDISSVGVGAIVGISIQVGEIVQVQVGLVSGRAKVIRCESADDDFRIGMEFLAPRLV